jgi:hypothetical protein
MAPTQKPSKVGVMLATYNVGSWNNNWKVCNIFNPLKSSHGIFSALTATFEWQQVPVKNKEETDTAIC